MDELDDLFRQALDGHASEPAADLWARLQASAPAEAPTPDPDPLDARFRAGLAGHATPPPRELWERLEDEHLRPRQRRRPVVAWGRLAVAASLLVLVLGGAGLWWGYRNQPATGPVAVGRGQAGQAKTEGTPVAATPGRPAGPRQAATAEGGVRAASASRRQYETRPGAEAFGPVAQPTGSALAARMPAGHEKNRKSLATQATGPAGPASASLATGPTGLSTAAPRPGAALASAGGPPAPAAEPEVILVEIRRGPAAPAPPAAVATTPPRPSGERTRLRLNGLLRQAGHLAQGEPLNLAEAGLPDSLTLQTRLGSRVVSRTIRF